MTTSVQSVVDSVRSILQDTQTPYRYSDDDLVDIINYTLRSIARLRPDLFFGSFPPTITDVTISDNIPAAISDEYVPQIVLFVTGWAELRDDDYTDDKRAVALMQTLKSGLR